MKTIIPKSSVQECDRWQLPIVGKGKGKLSLLNESDVNEIAAIKQSAYNEAKSEGYAAGEEEVSQYINKLSEALQLFSHPLSIIQNNLQQQIFELVTTLSQQCIKHELSLKPELLLGIIDEATNALPAASTEYQLFVNPDDAKFLKEVLQASPLDEQQLTIESDESLSSGEIRLSNTQGEIDGTIAARIKRIAEQLIGAQE